MAIPVNTYTKHNWVDDSSPDLEAEVLNEIETGIKDNNDAIKAIAAAVVSQIVNDPDKIASMAALYAVNQTLGNLSTTVTNINSNLTVVSNKLTWVSVATNIPTGGAASDTWIYLQENTENYKELRFVFGSPKGGTQTGWFEYRIRKWVESDWQIDKTGSAYGRIRIPQPDGTDCSLEMRADNGFLIRTTSTNYALRAVYARKG